MAKYVYGIDLGTTYSCVAYPDETGNPVVVPNPLTGKPTTASVVQFPPGEDAVVGDAAKEEAVLDPDHTIQLVKQLIGKTTEAYRDDDGNILSPSEVSSYILKQIAAQVKESTGDDMNEVVITCPAYFGENERTATKQAGEIAGLKVLSIIEEPTAAAIYYGVTKSPDDKTVLVYDLGGGTFDITVLKVSAGEIRTITTEGDHSLGGKDWDQAMQNLLGERFIDEHGADGDAMYEDNYFLNDLAKAAEETKIALTERTTASKPLQFGGSRGAIKVSRDEFDEATKSLLNQTLDLTQKAVDTTTRQGLKIDEILMVGGSTKMPQVRAALMERFNLEPKMLDPDEAVAKGAAIFAIMMRTEEDKTVEVVGSEIDQSSGENIEKVKNTETGEVTLRPRLASAAPAALQNLKVIAASTKSFGVEVATNGDREEQAIYNLIFKDTEIPTSATQEFSPQEDNQPSVLLKIYQSTELERIYPVDEDFYLGETNLELPPGTPASTPIEVSMNLQADGTLQITAQNKVTGDEVEATFQSDAVLDAAELEAAQDRVKATGLRM